jgi:hypothetical protein
MSTRAPCAWLARYILVDSWLICYAFGRTLRRMNETNISANFSPEDWALVRSAPLMAGLLVTLSDLRTGPIGILKEGFAPSQALIEAGERAANPIVASIVASIKETAKKGERLKPPFDVSGKTPEQLKADVAATLKRIPAILEGKVPAEQVTEFKRWLVTIADKVAGAGKEGGFLGFGGERVSAAESTAIKELASTLGVQA